VYRRARVLDKLRTLSRHRHQDYCRRGSKCLENVEKRTPEGALETLRAPRGHQEASSGTQGTQSIKKVVLFGPLLETFSAYVAVLGEVVFLMFFERPLFRHLDAVRVTKGEKGRRNRSLWGDFWRLIR